MKPPLSLIRKLKLKHNHPSCHNGSVCCIFPDAQRIGQGFFRAAYRVGDWVIKKQHGRHSLPSVRTTRLLQACGFKPAPTWSINGWVIQRYYQLASDRAINQVRKPHSMKTASQLDLGYPNMGIDTDGSIVAFDW